MTSDYQKKPCRNQTEFKVLFLCLRMVFDVNESNINRTTGYSYLVRDMADYIGGLNSCSVDLISINDEPALTAWNNINLIQHKALSTIKHFRFSYILLAIKIAMGTKGNIRDKLKIAYYCVFGGWLETIIRNNDYDFVSIQGVNKFAIPYMYACKNVGVPFGLSLHALDCSKEDSNLNGMNKILQFAKNYSVPVSFISSRMKEKAQSFLCDDRFDNADCAVIANGAKMNLTCNSDIRTKYSIPISDKICLCSGNINNRKNQIELIEAFSKLSASDKSRLWILLVGNQNDSRIPPVIDSLGEYASHVIICGPVEREEIYNYFYAADFVSVVSKSEGFGISIVESFLAGKPVLAFSDLDAVDDLYNKDTMLLVDRSKYEALNAGLKEMLHISWNSDLIKKHGRNFTFEAMALKYYDWFRKICEGF